MFYFPYIYNIWDNFKTRYGIYGTPGQILDSYMLGIIINLPIDFHIFQDGYCATNQPIDPIYPI